jgi:hypothetical protein
MPNPKYPRARLSPAKDELLVLVITRESVVTGDVRPLLCRGHREAVQGGMIGWQFAAPQELPRQVDLLLGHLNALYDRLGLPQGMKGRVSEEIGQLIECALE